MAEKKQVYQTVADDYGMLWVLPVDIERPDLKKIAAEGNGIFVYGDENRQPVYGPFVNEQHARSFYERLPQENPNQ